MVMTDSPYTQAEVGYNAAATKVGRPATRNRGTLRNRTKLWKVRWFEGEEGLGLRKATI